MLNSTGIVCVITLAAFGLSLGAHAAESASETSAASPTKAATIETASDNGMAAWQEKEAKLLGALKEVIAAEAERQKGDTTVDWNAVETKTQELLFRAGDSKDEGAWPVLQLGWIHKAQSGLRREERHEKNDFALSTELETLGALEAHVRKIEGIAADAVLTKAAIAEASAFAIDLSAWQAREAKLLSALKEVIESQPESPSGVLATDWNAVEARVQEILFRASGTKDQVGEGWPVLQLGWIHKAQSELRRAEKHEKERFTLGTELDIIDTLDTQIRKVEGDVIDSDQAATDAPAAQEDEALWKFRDKSGARTTKARYKGQEPVN